MDNRALSVALVALAAALGAAAVAVNQAVVAVNTDPDSGIVDSGGRPDATAPDATFPDAQPGLADTGVVPGPVGTRALGTNFAQVTYWETNHAFANILQQARPWSPSGGQYTLLFSNGGAAPGDYVFTWSGTATFQVSGWQVISTAANRMVLRSGPAQLMITHVAGTASSLVLQTPGTQVGDRWNPTFLASLSGMRVLRFMDWQRTNDNIQADWASRPLPTDTQYTGGRGAPLEVMTDLANRVVADPWLCVPHTADDAYVHNMARTVCSGLGAGRRVYVEHSNEVWNGIFPQEVYAEQRAQALGIPGDAYLAGQLYHARRSAEIGAIWQQECGAARVVRVLGAWAANVWTGNQQLAYLRNLGMAVDAVAIAPYFGSDVQAGEATSVDNVFAILNSRSLPRAISWMHDYHPLEATYGIQVIGYEGGQHLVQWTGAGPADTVFQQANQDPRMGAVYSTYLAAWATEIGAQRPFVHYLDVSRWATYGAWGARQTLNESCASSPKCTALDRYLRGN